jgi:hypothetical protein
MRSDRDAAKGEAVDRKQRSRRQEHAFIVRVWHEASDDAAPWRGSVEHVSTHRRHYFADLSELLDFIRQNAAAFGQSRL